MGRGTKVEKPSKIKAFSNKKWFHLIFLTGGTKEEVDPMEEEKILIEKLEKLSKCKGLSKEDLQGRYKNSYQRLKGEINKSATAILREIALGNLRWDEIDWRGAATEVDAFINVEPAGKTIMKNISHALYKHCSFEEFHAECLKMREQVKHILWKYAPQDWETIEMET